MNEEVSPTLSVIIPVRDQLCFLTRLLDSLKNTVPRDVSVEILVIDDGSRERAEELCERYGARYFRNEESIGPAAARNVGAAHASGAILLFFDADVECPEGLIEKVLEEMGAHPDIHAISFLSVPYSARDGFMKNFGAVLEYFWFHQYFREGEELAVVQGVTTRNFAVRRDVFEAVGGFDTRFKTNAIEDYDLGKRLAAQYKLVLMREPKVYHNFPDSFLRVMRNYFVRAALWVPYYLQYRPRLDPVQVSADEARLRVVACSVPVVVCCGALPGLWGWTAWGLALFLILLYGIGIRKFLRTAWHLGHSLRFVVFCAVIHFLSAFPIVAGGCWGLLRYFWGKPIRTM